MRGTQFYPERKTGDLRQAENRLACVSSTKPWLQVSLCKKQAYRTIIF